MTESQDIPEQTPPFVVDAETAPLPSSVQEEEPPPVDVGVWSALRFGVITVLARPRVLLFLVILAVLSALPPAIGAYHQALQDVAPLVERSEEPLDFLHSAPGWFLAEWERFSPGHAQFSASLLTPGLLAAAWFGLLLSAGWMGIARHRENKHGLADFLAHGGRFFFPFFRTWVLGLPLFAIWTWVLWETPAELALDRVFPNGDSALATSESFARSILHAQELLYVVGLFSLELALDLGRASMIRRGGRSALVGVLAGLRQVVFHPVRPLLFSALAWGFELALLAGLALTSWLPWWTLLLFVPLTRHVFRGARLAGFVVLTPSRPKN